MARRITTLLTLLAAASCGSSTKGGSCPQLPAPPADAVPLLAGACDPLVPSQCGYPFPSNVYLVDDSTTHTGKRVAIPKDAMPLNKARKRVDPALVSDADGFSPSPNLLTHMPGATVTGLPDQTTIADSLGDASPTIILDAATGERVPNWAELDEEVAENDVGRALIIHPAIRLKDGTRYIVAIRHVVDATGAELPPTPAFQALRDGTASCEPSVALRKDLYADIFGKLEAAGVPRAQLQLAWDFSTASRENNTQWLLAMRDDALAQVGADGPSYTLFPPAAAGTTPDPATSPSCNNLVASTANPAETSGDSPSEIGSTHCSQDAPNGHIWRRLFGLMTVPIYTTTPNPGANLNLGPDGMPMQNGVAEYEFEVNIPVSATVTPGKPLANGHGLLGAKTEGQDSYLATVDDQGDYVSISVDLLGMDGDDVPGLLNALAVDPVDFKHDIGRQHQGLLNELLAMRLMNGLAKDPATFYNSSPTIDASDHFYRGDSQGGIFGTTYMSISTDVTRGILGEPGMPYGLLLNRSVDFQPFFGILDATYPSSRDLQLLLDLLQMAWDRTEPDGYAPYIVDDNLPGTPAHRILIQANIGDYQVTPLGAELIARATGAKDLSPVPREVFGLTDDPGPVDGSAIVEWSWGLEDAPLTNTPPGDLCPSTAPPLCDDPHDQLRFQPEAIQQEIDFLNTGIANQTCPAGGPCLGTYM
jgi:hypothetical protein